MSSRAVAANKRRAKGKPKGTAAASTQDPSISGRPSTSMGMSMSAAEEELHVSGSFWELYDNVADDEVTQTGTSRHGFLAGEQSWSMRSSTTAQPARGGGRIVSARLGAGGRRERVRLPSRRRGIWR